MLQSFLDDDDDDDDDDNNNNNNNKIVAARQFLSDLSRRISRSSGDDKETSFLFQRISVLLFRFNSVLLHDGFVLDDRPEQ